MNYTLLDPAAYPRQSQLAYFRSLAAPHVGVTVELEVGRLKAFCKQQGGSFYLAFLHIAALAADSVPQLRQRLHGDGVAQYDECGTSHVELLDDGTCCYCTLYHHMPWDEYLPYAEQTRRLCRERASFAEDENVEGLYFMTTLPWLRYTALVQPTGGGDDSNPRISWGKFEPDAQGRLMMPVTLLAHHALVDGLHIARFYEALQNELALLPLK